MEPLVEKHWIIQPSEIKMDMMEESAHSRNSNPSYRLIQFVPDVRGQVCA